MTREQAVRLLKGKAYMFYGEVQLKALAMAIEALDQEPKQGKWEHYLKEGLKWKCSECGSKYTTPWHYCPNCGARMESDGE